MDELQFEIVLPCKEHAKIIIDWRNDKETLTMSVHTEPKQMDSFYPEFLRHYFSASELCPLFACYHGKRIAFLRFEDVPDPQGLRRKCCAISINVSPENRGRGLGTQILLNIQSWVKKYGYDFILAEIKPENIGSKKAFENAGYKLLEIGYKELSSGETIPMERYVLELSDSRPSSSVFIIAEAGSNWCISENQEKNFSTACQMIDAAALAKCDAIKFQTFRAKKLYVPNAGESGYLSKMGDIYSLIRKLEMPYEWISQLSKYCKEKKIHFMSTFFSPEDFQAIDPYVAFHKIASYEITDPDLIHLAASSGKPTFISTGAASDADVEWAVEEYFHHRGKHLTLMQCTATYPAGIGSLNLDVIPFYQKKYGVQSGLSDHSEHPWMASVAAVALGVFAIEKHFTLNRSFEGPDQRFSILPEELQQMVVAIRETEKMLGDGIKRVLPEEKELFAFARRGVQAIQEIQKGEVFQIGKNIAILRPGNQPQGIHPKFLSTIQGKRAKRKISLGEGIQFDDI